MADDLDLPALIAWHEEMAQEPCPSCGGSGQTIVGENHVTEDMAIDAGDRSLAGMFHSYAYGHCDECGASGITEAADRAQQTAAALRQLQSLKREAKVLRLEDVLKHDNSQLLKDLRLFELLAVARIELQSQEAAIRKLLTRWRCSAAPIEVLDCADELEKALTGGQEAT